ncbi:hypothetical protein A1D31_22725 [Bradyrhizobium liaoningense]|nr:hypothetical protein A1D31_22725 [Bradyrhizobium liaoningense]
MHAMLPFIAVVVGLTFLEPAGVALDLLLPAVTMTLIRIRRDWAAVAIEAPPQAQERDAVQYT